MTPEDISYALAKQLASASAIESSYGQIMLDDELRQAVDAAARPILERRMKEADVRAGREAAQRTMPLARALDFDREASA